MNVRNEMQEKAKRLAGDLLNEHFPNMRQNTEMKEGNNSKCHSRAEE